MATHDYVISNASGAAVRADLNNALAAIVSNNSNATEPSTTYAYQWWADIGSSPAVMKLRNAANDGWITLFQLDGEWSTIALEDGTAAAPSLYFKDSGTDTGFFSGGTDQVNITTGGTERVEWGASEVVFNDGGENYDFRIEGDTNSSLFFVDASADTVEINGDVTITDKIIHSGDTNTAIRFPAADTFSIETAGSEAARIDSSGRLLVGTSTSRSWGGINSQFQIENVGASTYASQSIIANSPDTVGGLLVLGKSRGTSLGSHTAVQNNDLLGRIYFYGADGSQLVQSALIEGWVDGTPGTNDMPGRLVFSTTKDGQSSPTEAARINSNQDLLVGTSTSSGKLSVEQTSANANGAFIANQTHNYQTLALHNKATANDNLWVVFGTEASLTSRGTIDYNRAGGLTRYNTTSDYRAKNIIGPVQNSGRTIDALKVYEGIMKGATQSRPMLIAHEVQEYAPFAVSGVKDEMNEDGTPKYQQIDVSSLVPLLLAEIQSLRKRVATLETT